MQNLLDDLTQLLSSDDRFVVDGKLLKNRITESALKLDPELLKLLLTNSKIKNHFFQEIDNFLVFDKIKFQKFVNNKAFLPDSYTAFKNKIGLTSDDEYISESKEVVLAWPYKDCVLEGGQEREEQKRKEIFWNEILAPDKIDCLLSEKAFHKFTFFDKNGGKNPSSINESNNFIIKGNNLLSLTSIAKVYKNKIKLIYIDPPYNTGNDGFNYNDSFNHSTWLSFMKNRLEIAQQLLSNDGSIWINIDDKECHYLKILADEIFGRDNFVINFIWQKKYSPANDAKWFSDVHDHILVYAKDKQNFRPNLLKRTEKMNLRYSNPDNDPRGPWKSGGFSVKTYSKEYDYPIETPSGKIVLPPKGSCWQTSKENYLKKLQDNRIWFGPNGDSKPQLKQFLSEVQQGVVCKSIWFYDEVGHNQVSRSEITKLFGDFVFATPKPEKLIKRIIDLSTNENDLVLDFFLGSGTTAAVAHKMNRFYIGIDQMDYIEDVAVKRLQKVISGENGGVSPEVNWEGGGNFIYMELIKLNQKLIDKINCSTLETDLNRLFNTIINSPYINYQITNTPSYELKMQFQQLDIRNKKQFLFDILDKNNLYINYSELEDFEYGISIEDIHLNAEFYSREL